MVWHKLLSKQRRRAVVACFRMTPLYNIKRFSWQFTLITFSNCNDMAWQQLTVWLMAASVCVVSEGTGSPTCSWTVTSATGWGMRATRSRIRWSMISLWVCAPLLSSHCSVPQGVLRFLLFLLYTENIRGGGGGGRRDRGQARSSAPAHPSFQSHGSHGENVKEHPPPHTPPFAPRCKSVWFYQFLTPALFLLQ